MAALLADFERLRNYGLRLAIDLTKGRTMKVFLPCAG